MKKRNLFLLAFAALAFAACSSDDVIDEGGGTGTPIDPNGESWMSLNIAPAGGLKGNSRALAPGEEEVGKAEESKVNSVRVILFDGYNGTSKVTNDVMATFTTSSNIISTDGFKVSNSAKSILVIVNPSAKLPATNSTTTYDVFNTAIINASVKDVIEGATSGTYDNFMMTNSKGGDSGSRGTATGLEPSKDDTGIEPGTGDANELVNFMESTADAAKGNPVPLKVDRVAAKVRLYNNHIDPTNTPTNDSEVGLKVGNVKWDLNVTNKKFFPISKRTYTYLENEAIAVNYNNFFTLKKITADQYGFGSYRVDPNYDNYRSNSVIYTESAGVRTYTADYISNFAFYENDADAAWMDPTNTGNSSNPESSANIKNNPIYCLENTQDKAGNYHAFTTHALVKANIQPSHFKDMNPTDGSTTYLDNNSTEGWIKIGSGYYSFTTLNNWVKRELYVKYLDLRSGNEQPTTVTDAYIDYLNSILGLAITLPTWDAFKSTYSVNESSTDAAIRTAVDSAILAIFINSSSNPISLTDLKAGTTGLENGFTFYEGGISYYKIMVKQDNDTDTGNNELGEFGVTRNSVYDISINKFIDAGYPEIPLPDKEKPNEGDTYLSINIEMNPWTWYTQTENL